MNKLLNLALLPLLALGTAATPRRRRRPHQDRAGGDPHRQQRALGHPRRTNALKYEVARINAAGGLLGRQIELIAYDYKGDQLEGVNVTKRLVGDGVCAIVGPGSSGTGIAMTAVTEAAGVPMVATSATNPKVTFNFDTKKPIKTAFRACFIDRSRARSPPSSSPPTSRPRSAR